MSWDCGSAEKGGTRRRKKKLIRWWEGNVMRNVTSAIRDSTRSPFFWDDTSRLQLSGCVWADGLNIYACVSRKNHFMSSTIRPIRVVTEIVVVHSCSRTVNKHWFHEKEIQRNDSLYCSCMYCTLVLLTLISVIALAFPSSLFCCSIQYLIRCFKFQIFLLASASSWLHHWISISWDSRIMQTKIAFRAYIVLAERRMQLDASLGGKAN